MSRFAFVPYRRERCAIHGEVARAIGVARNPGDISWQRYCEKCAADLILKRLKPLENLARTSAREENY